MSGGGSKSVLSDVGVVDSGDDSTHSDADVVLSGAQVSCPQASVVRGSGLFGLRESFFSKILHKFERSLEINLFNMFLQIPYPTLSTIILDEDIHRGRLQLNVRKALLIRTSKHLWLEDRDNTRSDGRFFF